MYAVIHVHVHFRTLIIAFWFQITRVRQLLTEILLDVTDSEMESISKEVLFNESEFVIMAMIMY